MKIINKIRNITLSLGVFLGIIGIAVNSVLAECAVGGTGSGCDATLQNPLGSTTSFGQLVGNIATAIAQIGIPIAAVFIIYSGLLFVTARGNETKIKKARTAFFYAILGTAILLGAQVLGTALKATVESLGTLPVAS